MIGKYIYPNIETLILAEYIWISKNRNKQVTNNLMRRQSIFKYKCFSVAMIWIFICCFVWKDRLVWTILRILALVFGSRCRERSLRHVQDHCSLKWWNMSTYTNASSRDIGKLYLFSFILKQSLCKINEVTSRRKIGCLNLWI